MHVRSAPARYLFPSRIPWHRDLAPACCMLCQSNQYSALCYPAWRSYRKPRLPERLCLRSRGHLERPACFGHAEVAHGAALAGLQLFVNHSPSGDEQTALAPDMLSLDFPRVESSGSEQRTPLKQSLHTALQASALLCCPVKQADQVDMQGHQMFLDWISQARWTSGSA